MVMTRVTGAGLAAMTFGTLSRLNQFLSIMINRTVRARWGDVN